MDTMEVNNNLECHLIDHFTGYVAENISDDIMSRKALVNSGTPHNELVRAHDSVRHPLPWLQCYHDIAPGSWW
jgi:hypothetical protein